MLKVIIKGDEGRGGGVWGIMRIIIGDEIKVLFNLFFEMGFVWLVYLVMGNWRKWF